MPAAATRGPFGSGFILSSGLTFFSPEAQGTGFQSEFEVTHLKKSLNTGFKFNTGNLKKCLYPGFPGAQWVGLRAPNLGGPVSTPGRGKLDPACHN